MENTHTTPTPAPAGNSTDTQPDAPAIPSSPATPPCFDRLPGESSRAYGAFLAYFQLGHSRSLQGVADKLGESHNSIKHWSSKFDWSDRIQSFNNGLLRQQAEAAATAQLQRAANWEKRVNEWREHEWRTAQELRTAAQCFLESFGDEEVRRMTLSQASRALCIASQISRSAIAGIELPPSPEAATSAFQEQMMEAIRRAYGEPDTLSTSAAEKVG